MTENRLSISVTNNGWGTIQEWKSTLGTFSVQRRDLLDYNGNPIYIIAPQGYINELPKIAGTRRNHSTQRYTMQSYNIDMDMIYFLEKMEQAILKGERLHHHTDIELIKRNSGQLK